MTANIGWTYLNWCYFVSRNRLKDISDRLNRFGQSSHAPSALNSLKALVKQIVIAQNHFAFLLEDGHVCRVAYSVIVDRLDLTKPDPNKK